MSTWCNPTMPGLGDSNERALLDASPTSLGGMMGLGQSGAGGILNPPITRPWPGLRLKHVVLGALGVGATLCISNLAYCLHESDEPPRYGPFWHYEPDPTTIEAIVSTNELWGTYPSAALGGAGGLNTTAVRAYTQPLGGDKLYVEFYTTVKPRSGSRPSQALWPAGLPGVSERTVAGVEYAVIPIEVVSHRS